MAQYADNTAYLDIDGTALCAYFKSVSLEIAGESVDITAGCSTTFRERALGRC